MGAPRVAANFNEVFLDGVEDLAALLSGATFKQLLAEEVPVATDHYFRHVGANFLQHKAKHAFVRARYFLLQKARAYHTTVRGECTYQFAFEPAQSLCRT